MKLTASLPLLVLHLSVPPNLGQSQGLEAFLDGRAFVFGQVGDRVLFPGTHCRHAFALLLAGLLYLATLEMFGDLAALAALVLFSVFDPERTLAHGTLVSDRSCQRLLHLRIRLRVLSLRQGAESRAAGHRRAGRRAGHVRQVHGIFVFPMLVLLAGAEAMVSRSSALLGPRLAACAAILVCAWGLIWVFYGFRYAPAPAGFGSDRRRLHRTSRRCRARPTLRSSRWSPSLHLLPEAYIWGLANTKKTEWEYTSYFFGEDVPAWSMAVLSGGFSNQVHAAAAYSVAASSFSCSGERIATRGGAWVSCSFRSSSSSCW